MDKDFLRLLKEKEWVIPYSDDSIKLNISKIDNWPKNLDTENLYFEYVSPNMLCGKAGGDWQDLVSFNIIYRDNKLILVLFDSYTKSKAADVKKGLKEIHDYLTEENIKESLFNRIYKLR